MFARILSRSARTGLTVQKRAFSSFPKGELKPLTYGKNPFKQWVMQPGAWPVLGFTTLALIFAAYKVVWIDCMSPEATFSPKNRETINFIENDISPERNRIFLKPN